MRIFIYWNYKDNDSKKIYQFLKNSNFLEKLKEENTVIVIQRYSDFTLDEDIITAITESDIIMFFTHGEEDAILKFRYKNEDVKDRFIFINSDNAGILKEKKVLAFCCSSAAILGEYCCSEVVKSKFYIGFKKDIIYGEEFRNEFRSIVYNAYSGAFEKALLKAYQEQWTADKFARMLKFFINQMLTEKILSSSDRKLGAFSSASRHRETANSLVALGERDELVFG